MPSKKPKQPPIPLEDRYPNKFTQWRWDFSNTVFNRLYPVKPWLFGVTLAGSFAYYNRAPIDSFPTKFLNLANDSDVIRLLKLSGLSFCTAYLPVFLLRNLLLRLFIFRYKGFLKEDPKKVSITTRIWALCYGTLKKLAPPRLETCDAFLPAQPVPALRDTIERYLVSVECILSEEEFIRVKELAADFQQKEGKWLQLCCRIYSLFKRNYVTDFWEKYAYLYSRKPLLVNSSVAHVDLFRDVPANQAVRVAHMVHLEAMHMLAIVRQKIKPLGDGLVYSGHYKKLYATNRVPGETMDHLKSYRHSRHVAIYYKGFIYTVEAFDANNRVYSIDQLTQVLLELLQRNDVAASEAEAKLPTLTHDSRDVWYKNRQKFFLENATNKKLLERVESAFLFIILRDDEFEYDPEHPEKLDWFMKNMLAGNIRWADKSLNYIVGRNGTAGGNTEHSIGDGAEFDHLMENFCATDLYFMTYPEVVEDIDSIPKCIPDKGIKLAEKLQFDVSDEMAEEIKLCNARYVSLQSDLDLAALIFTDFGKGRIKIGKCSPDAFVQMAIQLANYKQHGRFVLTYESASSRFFANSRTETLRTVSKDSCAFVKAMLDEKYNKAQKLERLQTACKSHHTRNREIMLGKGVDRHLFVLYILSRAAGVSSAFLNYYISQPWTLSTSQPPNVTNQVDEDSDKGHTWLGASFGPVCQDGYGVCYRFGGEHSICIYITSFKSSSKTDSDHFRTLLKESLIEMANLFSDQ
ncbi:choline/Carnitine o-acyltransferase domain-containing protein [Ditylenchus destructor]|uniref:Choline/Carnitine o-acyltransferase domain-containing protein n=1 Tax=Ditylenchus destructor TaxID=166010 RepID=A0AAD4MVR2_9BILA|nr:choline/Carnitine o-acyltransferase domain-containing protein [Ditylenchus destructor]